jgi:4-amino-4-deoxy-L-arabinose transferase-like glycosyltransferase
MPKEGVFFASMRHTLFIWLVILLSGIAYFAGLQLNVMDVDSAQYASISREMAETGEFLEIKSRGRDYLDKPPLLFWAAASGFKLFGVHNWSFKIIPFFFLLISVYATYQLGKLLKDAKTGFVAALILGSCQAYFLFSMDLRTDTLLTAFVILSTLQIYRFTRFNAKIDLLWGAVFLGLAMLAKGPLGLIIPAMALGGHWLINREWKLIFKWEWILALVVIALVLSPMSYGLYQQFDSQPDKITFMPGPKGLSPVEGVSGLRFFFWEQSFGRITGENVWKDNSGPFFFVHNFLWSFMPWALITVMALFWKSFVEIKSLFQKGKGQFLLLCGFLLPFLALSTSQYKLPHYIFPLYPFAALLTAEFIVDAFDKKGKLAQGLIHFGAALPLVVSLILSSVLLFWVFNVPSYLRFILPPLAILCIWAFFLKNRVMAIVLSLALVSGLTNMVLNTHFYPLLLKYQKGSEMAFLAKQMGAQKENTAYYKSFTFSFDYYMQSAIPVRSTLESIKSTDEYIFSFEDGLAELKSAALPIDTIIRFNSYPITELTPAFLNPSSRESTLHPVYLVVLDKN